MKPIFRIQELIKALGLSNKKFEEECSLSVGSIGMAIKRNGSVTDITLQKIVETYNANANWLLTGEGDMFIRESGDALCDEKLEDAKKIIANQALTIANLSKKL